MKNIGIHIFYSYFILPASQILLLDFLLSRLLSSFFTPIVPFLGKHNIEKRGKEKEN
jgi:hypothetical protein